MDRGFCVWDGPTKASRQRRRWVRWDRHPVFEEISGRGHCWTVSSCVASYPDNNDHGWLSSFSSPLLSPRSCRDGLVVSRLISWGITLGHTRPTSFLSLFKLWLYSLGCVFDGVLATATTSSSYNSQ